MNLWSEGNGDYGQEPALHFYWDIDSISITRGFGNGSLAHGFWRNVISGADIPVEMEVSFTNSDGSEVTKETTASMSDSPDAGTE